MSNAANLLVAVGKNYDPLIYLLLSIAGAAISYLMQESPVSEQVRKRVSSLMPHAAPGIVARTHMVLFILAGAVVAFFVADPIQSKKEAFLIGLGMQSTLFAFFGRPNQPKPRPDNKGETGGEKGQKKNSDQPPAMPPSLKLPTERSDDKPLDGVKKPDAIKPKVESRNRSAETPDRRPNP